MAKNKYADMFTLRKDGRYQASYTDDTGRHYLYDRDPERLWQKLQRASEPEEHELTFGDIARLWKAARWDTYSEGTKASYAACYERALAELGDEPALNIQPYDIRTQFERMRARGFSASTMKAQRTVYSLIFNYAITDEELGRKIRLNPVTEVKIPKSLKPAKRRDAPPDEIVAAIRASAETDAFALFPLLLMSTGFRRGEALGLRWRNVDFKNRLIFQDRQIVYRSTAIEKEPKTESGVRAVPLLPDLEKVLRRPAAAKDDDYIFHGDDPSRCMCESTYRRRWLSYCKRMGLVSDEPEEYTGKNGHKYTRHHYKPLITAHVFRHGYATLLFEAGVDEYTAQRLLGHANIETTRAIYTHLRDKKKNESISKLRAYVQSQLSTPSDVKNDVTISE